MKFPKLQAASLSRQTVDVFGGYNHNLRIGDNEFYEMQNMTSDSYPVLSPRGARGRLPTEGSVTALVSNHGLCRIEDDLFVLPNGRSLDLGLDSRPKTLVSMGAYVIILPDKKWINVAEAIKNETDCYGAIEIGYEEAAAHVGFSLCKEDGTGYDGDTPTQEPLNPANGALWIDTTGKTHVLKQWSETTGSWTTITASYVKIEMGAKLNSFFEIGDSVRFEISGVKKDIADLAAMGTVVTRDYADDTLVGSWTIREKGDGYIVVPGMIDKTVPITSMITRFDVKIYRDMPDMDYVIECGNRLWGCRYGSSKGTAAGKDKANVNEIYCSKLGDFKNWHSFQGISTDSYVASIGADGPFTGAISYQGHPVFFKENCMIEVYGSYPAEYRLQITPCDGVQEGCEKSPVIVNNILYYKSRTGVCAFDGSLPVQIGQAFGQLRYENAVAGSCANKYYISMQAAEGDGGWNLFAYDTAKGLWHREDDLHALQLCSYQNGLYCIPAEGGILTLDGSGERDTQLISWLVQTGDIGLSMPEVKYISRLSVRLQLAIGATVSFYARYDHAPGWEHLFTLNGTDLRSFSVPIRPKRCDHMQLKIQGVGEAKVYSVTKVIEKGSELL